MKKLRDRIAVVTGAASGIGRAVAIAFAREGCDLALADVDDAGLAETKALVESEKRRATVHHVDVADADRLARFHDEVLAEHGRVHILVNNAGVTVAKPFVNVTPDDWEWIVGVNFWGVVNGCRIFLPTLQAQEESHIVNVSSIFGVLGVPHQTSYCATKFAVRGFSEALRCELEGTSVGLTVVHPGGIATNIVKSARWGGAALLAKKRTLAFFERRGMPPDVAAAHIVTAVKRNRGRLLITREAYAIDWIKRLGPSWADVLIARGQRRFFPL